MTQTWIRIIAAALFMMGQEGVGVVPGLSVDGGKPVIACHMACCDGPACKCDMAPPAAPAKPVPAAPARADRDLKTPPVIGAALKLPPTHFSLPEPGPIPSLDLLLPHRLPPLAWHCALLI